MEKRSVSVRLIRPPQQSGLDPRFASTIQRFVFVRTPCRRTGNKSDKVMADINHIVPYLFLGFVVKKRLGMPINIGDSFNLVSAFKRPSIED
jgi:hypothetical protein